MEQRADPAHNNCRIESSFDLSPTKTHMPLFILKRPICQPIENCFFLFLHFVISSIPKTLYNKEEGDTSKGNKIDQ